MIPDEVSVDLPACAPAGIETRGHVGHVEHGDVAGQVGIESAHEPQGRDARGELHAGDLTVGMHARIGTTRPPHAHRCACHGGKGFFQTLLDRALTQLALPTRKVRPVVLDDQTEGSQGRGD